MWATHAIEELRAGRDTQIRPHGHSMAPRIKSGQLVTLSPVARPLRVGDAVLCRVRASVYLHLVKSIGADGRYLIGNNRGGVNGWASDVYGVVTTVAD